MSEQIAPQNMTTAAFAMNENPAVEADGADIAGLGSGVTYDDGGIFIPGVASATGVMQMTRLKPGQFFGGRSTTIYNALRSDPKVEKVLGREVYRTTGSTKQTIDQTQLEVAGLRQKVEQLTSLLAAALQAGSKQAVPAELESDSDDDLSGKDIRELRAIAKEKGINTFQMNKGQIIDALRGETEE